MRLPCYLREIRGKRPIRDLAEAAGIHRGQLSGFETGHLIPRDDQIPALERAYGEPRAKWYPIEVAFVLVPDTEEQVA